MRLIKITILPLVLMGFISFSACSKDPAQNLELTGGSGADTDDPTGGTDNGAGNGGMGGRGSSDQDAAKIGGPCLGDKDCRAISALCDETSNACVQCLVSSDCGAGTDCVAGSCVPFTECESSLSCGADEVCDKTLARCVECEGNNDCGGDQVCVNSACSATCSSDKDCTPDGQVCDLSASACVDCLQQADCGEGMQCSDQACVPALCSEGQGKCAGDTLLSCNAEGTGYDKSICESGCDAGKLVCEGDIVEGCGPRVRILVQRSGTMFEQPSSDNSWWQAVATALDRSDSDLLDKYSRSIEISLSTFHMAANQETCPVLGTKKNIRANGLSEFFEAEAAAHQDYVDSSTKVDAPLPEAIAQAASELGGGGERYLLLVITGLPDSCTEQDGTCAIDPTIAQLQAAHAAGIETKLLYVESSSNHLNGFPEAVANAGAGLAVEELDTGCDSSATYSESSGEAEFAQPSSVDEVESALSGLLAEIQACR